jgi:hypothetical protein
MELSAKKLPGAETRQSLGRVQEPDPGLSGTTS